MQRTSAFCGIIFILTCLMIKCENPSASKESEFESGTVTDIDGNVYPTVRIGEQWWMALNLKVTRYRNGEAIPNVTDADEWGNLTTGAYCNYDNDESYVNKFGRLYNWYAVDDDRGIAPVDWHVPTDEEWKQLEMVLGMSRSDADATGFMRGSYEGDQLKEAGTHYWDTPENNATNETCFTALPGGCRKIPGNYWQMGYEANFWTSTADSNYTWYRSLLHNSSRISRYGYRVSKKDGYSVRCVKD